MDTDALAAVLGWCTVINFGLLMFWGLIFMAAPGLVYRTQSRWFPFSRETFNVVFYSFLAVFKIVFVVFNLVPYLALRIVG